MRRGLLFTLLKKRPSILAKQKETLRYTFLQSHHLHTTLLSSPSTPSHQSILSLLSTPFHSKQLLSSSFLNEKADQHEAISEKIYNSLRKEKDKIVQNVDQLASRNIIDTKIWSKVFAEATELKFAEIQGYEGAERLFANMEDYLMKFEADRYKFCVDELELLGLFTLRDKCVEALKGRKDGVSPLKVENKIISLYGTAGAKAAIGFKNIKNYYGDNIIKNLQEFVQKETDVVLLTELEAVLDKFNLSTKTKRKIISNRIAEISQQEGGLKEISKEQYLTMAKSWATIGKMREYHREVFPLIFKELVEDFPVMMLQILVCCEIDEPQLIQKCIKVFKSIDYEDLNEKPKIHVLLHTLSNRQYDLSNHQRFVKDLCKDTCQKIRYDISELIQHPVGSQCMHVEKDKKPVYYPSISQKWITNTLKQQVQIYEGEQHFYFTKICQYFVIYGVIKDKKVYVFNFGDLNIAFDKPKEQRSMVKIQEEMFGHYGIELVQIKGTFKYIKSDVTKTNKKKLIEVVEDALNAL